MPNGAFEIIVMVAITWVCIHYSNIRSYCIVVSNIIALIGGILIFSISFSNKAGLLIGYYLVSPLLRHDKLRASDIQLLNFPAFCMAYWVRNCTLYHWFKYCRPYQEGRHERFHSCRLLHLQVGLNPLASKQTVNNVKYYRASILLIHTKASLS